MNRVTIKTILITSFHASTSRNILAAGVLSVLLKDPELRIVIAGPDYKKDYFEKEFCDERVHFVGISTDALSEARSRLFFKKIARSLLDSGTARIKAKAKLHNERAFFWYLGIRCLMYLGKISSVRRIARAADYWLRDRKRMKVVFDRWRPDLVVSTDIQLAHDTAVLHEAKSRGIRAIAKVRSWDNLTQWGIIRVIPEKLLVPTAFVKNEAIRYHGILPQDIRVIGIPHYDRYSGPPSKTREEFFRERGLDAGKKLVVYAPIADSRIFRNDVDRMALEILSGWRDANIIVRFPPHDEVSIGDFTPPPHMIFEYPGVLHLAQKSFDKDISPAEDDDYKNLLFHCDLVVSGTSTVAIDAAIFDKPIILIRFYPSPRSFWKGIIEYAFNHIQPMLESGGARVAGSREELVRWKERYFSDPALDREGRKRLVAEECFRIDGASSRRMAQEIFESLRQ